MKNNYTLYTKFAKQFGYEGHPFRLDNYRPFLPFYSDITVMEKGFKTGRQTSKSTNAASSSHAMCLAIPSFRVITALPYEKQAKDFAYERLNNFTLHSPIIKTNLIKDTWDRKGYSTGSTHILRYIASDVGKTRGPSGDLLNLDEYQEYDSESLPIIESCLIASDYELKQWTGTPLTTTNLLQEKWLESSQAEWAVPCEACNKWNIPSADEDLLGMIGKEGPICAKCGKSIDPSSPRARYIHGRPEQRSSQAGYHVPQIILPLHFDSVGNNKWYLLLHRKETWSEAKFFNEVLGEPKDTGVVPITPSEIERCCNLDLPDFDAINTRIKKEKYDVVIFGVDWGGSGKEGISRTAFTAMGGKATNGKIQIDTLYYRIFDFSIDDWDAIDEILDTFNKIKFNPKKKIMMHDLGAGHIYESSLAKSGRIDPDKIYGTELFLDPTKHVILLKKADETHPRPYARLNKTKAISLFFKGIKNGIVNFDKWERFQTPAKDFTAVEKSESSHVVKSPVMRIDRKANESDDLLMGAIQAFHGILTFLPGGYEGIFDPDKYRWKA